MIGPLGVSRETDRIGLSKKIIHHHRHLHQRHHYHHHRHHHHECLIIQGELDAFEFLKGQILSIENTHDFPKSKAIL